jgi:hypothetical protein
LHGNEIWRDSERALRGCFHLVHSDTLRNLNEGHTHSWVDVKDTEVSDEAIDAAASGERETAFVQNFLRSFRCVLHHDNDAIATGRMIKMNILANKKGMKNVVYLAVKSIAPPGPFTILPGMIQFAKSPFFET